MTSSNALAGALAVGVGAAYFELWNVLRVRAAERSDDPDELDRIRSAIRWSRAAFAVLLVALLAASVLLWASD